MGAFVHLHLHSEYSLLDGACRISEIPKAAKAAGHTAVALTDHGILYGAVAFYDACIREGIRPIIGCEVYVAPAGRFSKEGRKDQSGHHLILLAENETGYHNLCRMVTLSFTEGFYSKPRVDLELLEKYHEGLFCLSGCLGGYIPQCILAGDMTGAEEYARRLSALFGKEHFYLEIQNHAMEEERTVRDNLLLLSQKTGIPLVATGDVHYLKKTDARMQAVLLCIQTGNVLRDGKPFGFQTDEYDYKSTEEMERLFAAYPEAIANTVRIAERCHFDFKYEMLHLPTFKVQNGTPQDCLRRYAEDGLSEKIRTGRIDIQPTGRTMQSYTDRLAYELDVIHRMGFDEYYLIVLDFVQYAKGQGIPVGPGRGSGAGSLVAYAVGITDVDPLEYDLLFERFLNPERISMPDFDIDFCYDRRGEVIDYVKRRYGEDHVAQIVTFGTLAARAAVRDVGRALGMSYAETDAVAKCIPHQPGISIRDALVGKELRQMYDTSEGVRKLLDIAIAIEGMPRHASIHAAGVVITDKPTMEYVPLSGTDGNIVTEYDMDTVAKLGLVKFDFLGLRYLTILADAEKQIAAVVPGFSQEAIPMDDAKTYASICAGDTAGVFQLESGGMRQMLMQLRPTDIQQIIAAIALYRPGPMDSIPTFIARKNGREEVTYEVPALREILSVTYGCIVYQEQVMEIFRKLAGYSYAKADLVRRAMAKKKADVLAAEEAHFIAGCAQNGITDASARKIFAEMADFAHYAFNKSHAAAYGILSYRTAYFKCHYPAQYLSALMTSVLGDAGKLGEYMEAAQKRGIPVLPPDINESRVLFTAVKGGIRFGLLALKNVGRPFLEALLRERDKNGPFASFEDFLARMSGEELNRRQIEALIKCGAFDRLGAYRSQLMATYEEQISLYSAKNRSNISGQMDMFSVFEEMNSPTGPTAATFSYPDIPEFTLREKLLLEKECAGMSFSGHLLDEYAGILKQTPHTPLRELLHSFEDDGDNARFRDGQSVTVAGILSKITRKTTRNGAAMAFFTLEDRLGEVEVVVFPKIWEEVASLLTQEAPLLVHGTVSVKEEENVKILAQKIHLLQKEPTKRLVLRIDCVRSAIGEQVLACLRRQKSGAGGLAVLFYERASGKYVAPKNLAPFYTPELYTELCTILGKENVVLQSGVCKLSAGD